MAKRRRVSPTKGLCVVLLAALTSGGCENIARLRRLMRGESAGLRLEVTPADDLEIIIDGKLAATRSPLVDATIGAGSHVLEIRANGYHPVVLPFELDVGEMLSVPVTLRRAPATLLPTHTERPGTAPSPPTAPAPPAPPAAPLPPGVNPVVLTFSAVPKATLSLDDVAQPGSSCRLERVAGTLAVGGLALSYRLGGAGLLEFTLPSGDASWTRDGLVMLPGNSFRLLRGATRITRGAPDGTAQTLLLRR